MKPFNLLQISLALFQTWTLVQAYDSSSCPENQCYFCEYEVCEKHDDNIYQESDDPHCLKIIGNGCCERDAACDQFNCNNQHGEYCSDCVPSLSCEYRKYKERSVHKKEVCKFRRETCCINDWKNCTSICHKIKNICKYCDGLNVKDCSLFGQFDPDQEYECRLVKQNECCNKYYYCPSQDISRCERECVPLCKKNCTKLALLFQYQKSDSGQEIEGAIGPPIPLYPRPQSPERNRKCENDDGKLVEVVESSFELNYTKFDHYECLHINQPGGCCDKNNCSNPKNLTKCPDNETLCAYCSRHCNKFLQVGLEEVYNCMLAKDEGCCFGTNCSTPSENVCGNSSCFYCAEYKGKQKEDCIKLKSIEKRYQCLLVIDKCFPNNCCQLADLNTCLRQAPPTTPPPPIFKKDYNCSVKSCPYCVWEEMDEKGESTCPSSDEDFCGYSRYYCCKLNGYCSTAQSEKLNCTDEDACAYCDKWCDGEFLFPRRCKESKRHCCGKKQICKSSAFMLQGWGWRMVVLIIVWIFMSTEILNSIEFFLPSVSMRKLSL